MPLFVVWIRSSSGYYIIGIIIIPSNKKYIWIRMLVPMPDTIIANENGSLLHIGPDGGKLVVLGWINTVFLVHLEICSLFIPNG